MNHKQIEQLAKLYLDLGKLTFASLVLGFFQSNLPYDVIVLYEIVGLLLSAAFFIMGLKLIKE